MSDYVEKEDGKFGLQLTGFADGLDTLGAGLGFSIDEIKEARADEKFFNYMLNSQNKAQEYAQTMSGYKSLCRHGNGMDVLTDVPVIAAFAAQPNLVAANIEGRFRQKSGKAKSSTAYTRGKGETLKIVKPDSTFVPADGTPEFKIFSDSGHPLLKWIKGDYDGVEIWANHGSGFVKLDRDNKSPFVDKTDLPAVGQSAMWKYKMIYVLNDETVGHWSGELTVTVYGAV